jgi:hypothetical protein
LVLENADLAVNRVPTGNAGIPDAGRLFITNRFLDERIGDLSSTDVATGECSGSFRRSRFSGIYCTVTVTVSVFVMAPEVAFTVMM